MKKYLLALLAFVLIIATTFTLVQTGYYQDTLKIMLPKRLDYGQWILVYFNLFVFAYSMARSEKPKKAIPISVINTVVTVGFVIYYYSYIATL